MKDKLYNVIFVLLLCSTTLASMKINEGRYEGELQDNIPNRNSGNFSYKLPSPDVNISSHTTQSDLISGEISQLSQSNLKKLEFNPLLKLQSNKGGFMTSFSYLLPSYFGLMDKINFTYLSSYRLNNSFGHGWRWSVPRIRSLQSYEESSYSLEGDLGDGPLVEVQIDAYLVKDEIQKFLQSNGIDNNDYNLSIYQLDHSSDQNIFVRVQADRVYWVALLSNGHRWLFDSDGTPFVSSDLNDHEILFTWSGDNLISMRYSNGVQVHFQYNELGNLERIIKSDGDREISFSIKYKDNQLVYAGYADGVLPTFQASYSNMSEKISVTKDLLTIPDEDKDHFMSPVINGHDTKKISFKVKEYHAEIDNILNNLPTYGNINEYFVKPSHLGKNLENILNKVKFKITIGGHSVDLPHKMKPFTVFVEERPFDRWVEVEGICGTRERCKQKVHVIKNILRVNNERSLSLIDVDSDGHKDIVSCPIMKKNNDFAKDIFSYLNDKKSIEPSSARAKILLVKWSEKGVPIFDSESIIENAFDCSQTSFFTDWNHDGRIDIINGTRLTISDGESYHDIALDYGNLNKRFITFGAFDKSKKYIIRNI
jgi:hypothetical protein